MKIAVLKYLLCLVLLAAGLRRGTGQEPRKLLYKQVDTTSLFLLEYTPEKLDPDSLCPAMVFFFGGGFNSGNILQFESHAKYFASRGMICYLADYRVRNRHFTSPVESLKDAKSAIRFIRAHAPDLKVDPSRIVASGGSAGGHLAAATALVSGFDQETDDLSVSCIPDALVLFNPAIDNGPGGLGYERIGALYKDFSPLHNIVPGAPPTIFFLGTQDELIPVETAAYYKTVMEKVGSRCDLHLYEGATHGFFNVRSPRYYTRTVYEADLFLSSLGFLQGVPTIRIVD